MEENKKIEKKYGGFNIKEISLYIGVGLISLIMFLMVLFSLNNNNHYNDNPNQPLNNIQVYNVETSCELQEYSYWDWQIEETRYMYRWYVLVDFDYHNLNDYSIRTRFEWFSEDGDYLTYQYLTFSAGNLAETGAIAYASPSSEYGEKNEYRPEETTYELRLGNYKSLEVECK